MKKLLSILIIVFVFDNVHAQTAHDKTQNTKIATLEGQLKSYKSQLVEVFANTTKIGKEISFLMDEVKYLRAENEALKSRVVIAEKKELLNGDQFIRGEDEIISIKDFSTMATDFEQKIDSVITSKIATIKIVFP